MLFGCMDVMEILVAAMLLSIREMKNSQVLNRIDNGGQTRSALHH